jgi:hypothetical protein
MKQLMEFGHQFPFANERGFIIVRLGLDDDLPG